MSFLHRLFGDPNARVVKALRKDAERVGEFEAGLTNLSDDELRVRAKALAEAVRAEQRTVEAVTEEGFALVREAAKRTLGQRHFDVQLMGGLVLLRGGIAEMRTGEGKTLTSTTALFVRALEGKGCHLVTVNDYLARRDAVWMGQVFALLGMSVGCITHDTGYVYDPSYKHPVEPVTHEGEEKAETHDAQRDATGSFRVHQDYLRPVSRREAYAADITYGTNNEFGFDYLRDNMASSLDQLVMRGLHFALVDEIDSILIDEARTPLIISAPAEASNDLYINFAKTIQALEATTDYTIDEKMRSATLTDQGITKLEQLLGVPHLYTSEGGLLQHHADAALRAHTLFKRDVHYVVRDGEIVIVDEFTGRLQPGRRYSEGLHQAIEAKEGVVVQRESHTLATITFQNFFRLYKHLGGMTGTAATEAEEFGKIYKLEVTSIPTHRENKRLDHLDRIYKTERAKFTAVALEAKMRQQKGQPVLIGTVSIEKNELLAEILKKEGVNFEVLNAKNHEREAEIIAQAGRKGAVTLATNLAGRGVDIQLGGNPATKEATEEVQSLGGLCVIGTERHESRRIDNQLRGRSGRQGDPGETMFFVSLEDDLMRIFGSDRMKRAMEALKIPDDLPIENGFVTKALERAQERVEGHHFDTRKHLLEYDDVLNKHREVLFKRRREVLESGRPPEDSILTERMLDLFEGEVDRLLMTMVAMPVEAPEESPLSEKITATLQTFIPFSHEERESLSQKIADIVKGKTGDLTSDERETLVGAVMELVKKRMTQVQEAMVAAPSHFTSLIRAVILQTIDRLWIDHLAAMTSLRTGIGLRGYGQQDPLIEYKKESYRLFQDLLQGINQEIVLQFFRVCARSLAPRPATPEPENTPPSEDAKS